MEAIAIIGCIAAVVSAYRDGGAIVNKIKQKRLARQAPPPTRLLEESLARGPRTIEEAKENGIERFGSRYVAGDKIALDSLKDILIDLQGSLIKHLLQAQEDDNMTDFGTLVDASDIGRIKTVTVLNDLYMRVAMNTPTAQTRFGDAGAFAGTLAAGHNDHMAPMALPSDAAKLLPYPPPSDFNTTSNNRMPAPDVQETLQATSANLQVATRTSPKAGFFDRFRRKSSSEDSSSKNDKSRTSSIRSGAIRPKDGSTSRENHHHGSFSSTTMTSPQASIDEDNPWIAESSSVVAAARDRAARDRTPDESMSRATTLVPSVRHRPSTVSSTSSSSHERMLSPYELNGGFCKGAYKLQVHEKEAMKLRNQSTAKTGESYYWACCSSKCAFEGPARREGKNWRYDDTIRECHGIRYRWSFLAKAHVTLSKVKNAKYDYGCVFCIYDGFQCPAFHGINQFLEHIGSHRGKSIAETMLQRISCVNGRLADPDEDFDVNLLPIERQSSTIATDNFSSHPAHPELFSSAASDRVSWSTNDGTMADVDPWRDAT
ncbi:MAG: hypothetical protein L6R37_004852 [Teloschistes peruensis]|nr:MAG: hypothetical protein L6R37_004852 [Teloschistes peruensis]